VNKNIWDFLGEKDSKDNKESKENKNNKDNDMLELTTNNIVSSKIKDNITTEIEL